MPINIFSFFSGAGFLDLGFELTNFYKVVYVNEFHRPFNHIYRFARANMGIEEPIYGYFIGDVAQVLDKKNIKAFKRLMSQSKAENLTGIIGGPPCPDFSVAGKNRGQHGENGKLSGTYVSIICQSKPDFFLFENVKGLYRTAKHRAFFESLKEQLSNAGYYLTEQLINSIEYGAPQDRERIILIGISKKLATKLKIKSQKDFELKFDWESGKKYSRDVLTVPWPTHSTYNEKSITCIPNDVIEDLTVQYWWNKNNVLAHPNAKMYFQPRAGLTRFTSIEEGDVSKKCYKRLHRWRYSPTAAYGHNEVHIHPYLPRRISVAEALAIQSLPASFIIPEDVSLSDAFKTIGNGVPFLAAEGIAETLYKFLKENGYKD
ncbi:modification methylase HaeIII [Muribaculaceae bacterium]|uniref:DNA cytosine methyltransferase n=1 Tax=Bacteroides acidifaciens TaxID=85831 RepID=UPI00143416F1|nr:DNA cytosine methyltransferase [Bacteroides acidifaciens]GFI05910.1 modification methylase HaeIII [Muribaculaceae bacterium]